GRRTRPPRAAAPSSASPPGSTSSQATSRRPTSAHLGPPLIGPPLVGPSCPGRSAGVLVAEQVPHLGTERLGARPDPPTGGRLEGQLGLGIALDTPAAVVDEVVVVPAQRDEVVEVGRPAPGPVADVVDLADRALAPGKAAGRVASPDL